MGTTGLQRFRRDSDLLHAGLQVLDQDRSWDISLTKGLGRAIAARYDQVIDSAENGRPIMANSFGTAPELLAAMGLPWYALSVIPFLPMNEFDLEEQIDAAESLGLNTDLCSVIRVCVRYVYAGYVPTPTALVGALCPCDGASLLHQAILHSPDWKGVPAFCADPPYSKGNGGLEFFAGELRRMAEFLTRHTGAKLDLDRLRQTISESNRQHELWSEYRSLIRRAVPCPRGAAKGAQAWHVAQNFLVGDPRGTDWFRELLRITRQDVEEGQSDVPRERIRLLWFDIRPVWLGDLTQWLRDEWSACIVMDMLGYAPFSPVDTSSEQSMFRGLAERWMSHVPAVRQAHGTADSYAADVSRIVREYAINCVVWPGHVGHKDGAGSVGIVRQACADIDVPFLELGLDLLDRRCSPTDQLKDKISRFFSVKGLG